MAMKGESITPSLNWDGIAKRQTYFNAFDFDRESEPGFVVARFAFVRWGECVDCITIIIPKLLIEFSRETLLSYVKEVGLEALGSDFRIPPVPRFTQGRIQIADFLNVARSADIAEIAVHAFALGPALEAAKGRLKQVNAELLAILRSNTSLQIKWILTLYE